MILEAHGIRIELPSHWSGRVFAGSRGAATAHAGDFQLAVDDGQFGDRSTSRMPAVASFLALTEYLPGAGLEPGEGLFAARRIRLPLDPTAFSSNGLAHARPGHSGMQQFFTVARRPFCLYVVLAGGRSHRAHQLAHLNGVLRSLQIEPRRQ